MKKVIWSLIFGGLILTSLWLAFSGKSSAGQTFKTLSPERGDITQKALAVGTMEPEQEIRVKSTISGIVSEVYFHVGDPVKKGSPLFKVSPNPTPLEYVDARRTMEMSQISLDQLAKERRRRQALLREQMISTAEMEELESRYREAELRHLTNRERFQLLEKGRVKMANREIDSLVTAPIDGVILEQMVHEGDPVVPLTTYQPGTELCSMADLGHILFKGTVDEIDVGKLREGMNARIEVGALPGAEVTGTLQRISPKARKEGNATLFDLEIAITDQGGVVLRAGYSATANLTIAEKKQVLTVPERLVLMDKDLRQVEVLVGEQPEKRTIRTGLSDGLHMEVLEGLTEKDLLVERPPREIE